MKTMMEARHKRKSKKHVNTESALRKLWTPIVKCLDRKLGYFQEKRVGEWINAIPSYLRGTILSTV